MTTTTRESYDQVMMPNYAPGDVIPVRGSGSRVWDQAGTCLLYTSPSPRDRG